MTILTKYSPSFATTPIAAAAGSEARMEDAGVVRGAVPKIDSLNLEDAARVIRETAARLWGGSKAAGWNLVQMLLNVFRWITRPFRAGPKSESGALAEGQRAGAGRAGGENAFGDGEADSDVQRGAAPAADDSVVVPDDYLGQDEEAD